VAQSSMHGVVFGPLFNRSANVNGLQVGQAVNLVRGTINGAQVHIGAALLGTVVVQDLSGRARLLHPEFATFAFLMSGVNRAESLRGVQLGGWHNWARWVYGLQLGMTNLAEFDAQDERGGAVSGLQVGLLFNRARSVRGAQVGPVNTVRSVSGVQISGLVNSADSVRGVQIGLVNWARSLCGVQVGAVNVGNGRLLPVLNAGWACGHGPQ
jgi:hypothetical protein